MCYSIRGIIPFDKCCAVLRQVNGKIFYVDADNCADKELLELLSPADPDAVPQEPPQASSQPEA